MNHQQRRVAKAKARLEKRADLKEKKRSMQVDLARVLKTTPALALQELKKRIDAELPAGGDPDKTLTLGHLTRGPDQVIGLFARRRDDGRVVLFENLAETIGD